MKRLLFFMVCLVSAAFCLAREIHGTIKDSKGQVVPFANVMVLAENDSAFVDGAITNESGQYVLNVQGENLLLKVSCIGYKETCISIKNDEQNITLQEDAVALQDVIVKGNLPKYKTSLEGMVTMVSGSALSGLGTGGDVLRHIPGVFASNDEYVVFGKGTPLIYINGRKILNNAEIENLKSEDIKSVEVLTSPGAKYAATVKSVIKITTKRPVGEGFSINWLSRYEQSYLENPSTRLNWMYRHQNLDVFGNHYYGYCTDWMKSDLTQSVNSDASWFQSLYQDARSRYASLNNTFGMNYQLTKESSLGFRYINSWRMMDKSWATIQSSVFQNDAAYDELNSISSGNEKHDPTHQANVYYAGKVGKADLNIDLDYYHKQSDGNTLTQEVSDNYDSRQVTAFGKSISSMFASKATLALPIGKAQLSVGAEYTSTHRKDIYDNPEGYVSSSDSHIDEQHICPFGELECQLPFGVFQAGLRYEYAWYNYSEDGQNIAEQSKHFSNLFPSLSFMTQVGNLQLSLEYNAKTKRPTYSELSSNVFYGNRFTYQGGNPYLTPSTIHNVSLSAAYKILQMKLDYTDSRDAILYWAELYEGSNTTSFFSFKNINSLKTMTFFVAASPKVGFWYPTVQGGIIKQWLKMPGDEGMFTFNKPMLTVSLSNVFIFGNGWQGGLDLGYTSKGHTENIYISRSQFTNSVFFSKTMLNKCLTLYVGASDIFGPSKSGNEMQFPHLKTTQIQWKNSRNVYFSVRYKFNVASGKYRGKSAGAAERSRL